MHLWNLVTQMRTAIQPLGLAAAVIRTADFNQRRAAADDAYKIRLRVEGAIAASLRETSPIVEIKTGHQIALLLGVSKENADSKGNDLVGPDFGEAAAAALAACVLAGAHLADDYFIDHVV